MTDSYNEVLTALSNFKFPKNPGRMNVRREGFDELRSCIIGYVLAWGGCKEDPALNNIRRKELSVISKKNVKFTQLLMDFGFEKSGDYWDSICVNKSYPMAKHIDKNNVGTSFIIGLGNYTGGDLRVYEKDGSYNDIDIRKGFLFNGAKQYHEVLPFEGERFSLVYYNIF